MTYTVEQFEKDAEDLVLRKAKPEKLLACLTLEQRLASLTVEQRVAGRTLEQILEGLSSADRETIARLVNSPPSAPDEKS